MSFLGSPAQSPYGLPPLSGPPAGANSQSSLYPASANAAGLQSLYPAPGTSLQAPGTSLARSAPPAPTIQNGVAAQTQISPSPGIVRREQPEDAELVVRTSSNAPVTKSQSNKVLEVTLAVNLAALAAFCAVYLLEYSHRDLMRNANQRFMTPSMKLEQTAIQKNANERALKLHKTQAWLQAQTPAAAKHQIPEIREISEEQKNAFFSRGGLLEAKDGSILVVDHAPPAGFKGPLCYHLKNGIPPVDFGDNRLFRAIAEKRAQLNIAAQYGLTQTAKQMLAEVKGFKHELTESSSQDEVRAKLTEALKFDAPTLRKRGWTGDIPEKAPVHHWNTLSDHDAGYPHQLTTTGHTQGLWRVLGRLKIVHRGHLKTMRLPHVWAEKGARTLWTSVPVMLALGAAIAAIVIVIQHANTQQNNVQLQTAQ